MSECNFCNKYNMSHEDFKRAVQDGKISATVLRHDEIYSNFKKMLSNSSGREDAIDFRKTCDR